MPAIIFGSISTIADTSEMQRQAFNQAFQAHELDWCWNRAKYLTMLEKSGGQNRIADYANSVNQVVDAKQIHLSKSEFFQNILSKSQVEPRFGVVKTIHYAKSQGFKVAFATTTSQQNISLLMAALHPSIQITDFDLILDADSVNQPKPDKAAYTFSLEKLGEKTDDCIAVEDNLSGVESAIAAGLNCIAFPNENTAHHNFEKANALVHQLDFEELQKFLVSGQALKQF